MKSVKIPQVMCLSPHLLGLKTTGLKSKKKKSGGDELEKVKLLKASRNICITHHYIQTNCQPLGYIRGNVGARF